jgi:hypothetical protein
VGSSDPSLRAEKRQLAPQKELYKGILSRIPLSEEHCWRSSRKQILKTPTTGAQEVKITKNNSR